MIGYLGYRSVRGLSRTIRRQRKQDRDYHRAHPGGPWTTAAVLFTLLPFTVLWLLVSAVQGQLAGSLAAAGVNLALVLLLLAATGRLVTHPVLARYAEPEDVPDPGREFRERAAELRGLEQGAGGLTKDEEAERARRVAGLLSVPCPEPSCLAPEAVPCTLGSGQPPPAVVIVRKAPLILCHLLRMRNAVRYGSAIYSDIRAQFKGDVPAGIL